MKSSKEDVEDTGSVLRLLSVAWSSITLVVDEENADFDALSYCQAENASVWKRAWTQASYPYILDPGPEILDW